MSGTLLDEPVIRQKGRNVNGSLRKTHSLPENNFVISTSNGTSS